MNVVIYVTLNCNKKEKFTTKYPKILCDYGENRKYVKL